MTATEKFVSLRKTAGIVRRVITCTCQWKQSSSFPPTFTAIIGIPLYGDPHELKTLPLGPVCQKDTTPSRVAGSHKLQKGYFNHVNPSKQKWELADQPTGYLRLWVPQSFWTC